MTERDAWERMLKSLERITGGRVLRDEPLSRHTTIGVGGPARFMVEPRSARQVSELIRVTRNERIPRVVIGKGSNLIVRDGGFDGVVIKMGKKMSRVTLNRRTVRAQGGTSFARMCRNVTRAGRTGLEFGIGIPGTVGGAVRMNAGAFGGEVSDFLRRVWLVDGAGRLVRREASEIEFTYRHTSIAADAVVVDATFDCPEGEMNREAYDWAMGRKKTQPIDERTFGSTFVNPEGDHAARLIEASGLKGTTVGGAMISSKHANFIVNPDGNATAADVEALIDLMRTRVKESSGVDLKTEVVIIGNR